MSQENQKKPFFTVFSGTYNSEDVIERLFLSVESQTFRDFEWIIIDDNSSDNTVAMIKTFLEKNQHINARLIEHQDNTGIRKSRLEAVELAQGEYFVKWDHDDINRSDQLEAFHEVATKYADQNIGAIWCLCETQNEVLCGNEYPSDEHVGDYFSLYASHIIGGVGISNERHNCIATSVHKEVIEQAYVKGILAADTFPDATSIWATLSILGYKIVFINKRLRKYYIELNRNSMSRRGRRYNAEYTYGDRKKWVNIYSSFLPVKDFLIVQRAHFAMALYGVVTGLSLSEITGDANKLTSKILLTAYYPLAKSLVKIKGI